MRRSGPNCEYELGSFVKRSPDPGARLLMLDAGLVCDRLDTLLPLPPRNGVQRRLSSRVQVHALSTGVPPPRPRVRPGVGHRHRRYESRGNGILPSVSRDRTVKVEKEGKSRL